MILAVAVTAFSLIQSLIIPVLGPLAEQAGTDRATAAWLLTAYLLSASVFTPIVGRLGDLWGKDRMLVASLLLLAVGCLVSALAPNIGWMIAGRAVQGAGGGVMPVAFGIVRDVFPPRRVAQGISVIASLLAFGVGGGIVVAGPLVELLGYSWLFWLPCLVSLAAAGLAARVVPRSPRQSSGPISLKPAVLLAGWLVLLLLAVSQAPQWGWLSPTVLVMLAASVALIVGWIRAEGTARVPLVDMALMRKRPVWTANLVALLVGFGLYATSAYIPQLVQTPASSGYGFGVGVTTSGLILLPSAIASFLIAMVTSPLATRVGSKALIVTGCAVSASGLLSLALAHSETWQVCVGSGLMGLGTGLTMACLANVVVAAVPAGQTGVAAGMNANIRTIGGAIGSAVLGSLVTAGSLGRPFPAESGYVNGFLVVAVVLAVAAGVGLVMPSEKSQRPTKVAADPVPAA
ncbi:MFS transporter [Actinoplanes sp. CA-131856]